MMKDLRVWLGKYSTPNHDSLFEKVALCLVQSKRSLCAASQLKGEFNRRKTKRSADPDKHKKEIPIDRAYCKVMLYCVDTNLWGPGPLRTCKRGPYKTRSQRNETGRVVEDGECCSLSDGDL